MLHQYIQLIQTALAGNTFVKITLANYHGDTEQLKSMLVKKISIKNVEKLSITYRYQTKDIVKNFDTAEGVELIQNALGLNAFRVSTLFTTESNQECEWMPNGKLVLRKHPPTQKIVPSLEHNTAKHRLIEAGGKAYLHELRITDAKGEVYKNAQDKYKQINHYIELLSPLIKNLPQADTLSITDMGAGKGYLTFALYDYLNTVLKQKTNVTGVEFRTDLVELCNSIAAKSEFSDLKFIQGSIQDYDATGTNVLIALHACDTATDDAIYKGITANADLIVVAPCCHKQIRREMEKNKATHDLDFLLKHGIFMERQAEMVTDGLRSLLMEYAGYSTKVFQFISDAHTPKNVMITGEKKPKTESQKADIRQKVNEVKSFFGIKQHYLEKLLGLYNYT